jgi:hypothetical protein
MALRREIYDRSHAMFSQHARDQIEIANVRLDEYMALVVLYRTKVFEVPGVRQLVEIDNGFVALFEPVENEVRADKSGAASYEYRHV